jgi:NADPH-dependent 2,4-dienoyl-CoA reductase/sulfur reductase-like enzyme
MGSNRVIVVGGGLAGLSAAHTLLERGASVLLLDKQGSVTPIPIPVPVPIPFMRHYAARAISLYIVLQEWYNNADISLYQIHGRQFHQGDLRYQRRWDE